MPFPPSSLITTGLEEGFSYDQHIKGFVAKNTIMSKLKSPALPLVAGPVLPLMFPTTIMDLPAPRIVVVVVTGIVYNYEKTKGIPSTKVHVTA